MIVNPLKNKLETGASLIEVLVTIGIFGLLVTATMHLLSGHIRQSEHLQNIGLIEDVHSYIYNSISCSETLQDQQTQCAQGDYVTVRNHDGRTIIGKPPLINYFGNGVGLRTRCRAEDGLFVLDSEYQIVRQGQTYADKFTGKSYDWHPLNESTGFACPCIPNPGFNRADIPPTSPYAALVRKTFYFANVAVDPWNTGADASGSYGLAPYTLSPPSTLDSTTLTIPTVMLNDLIVNQRIEAIEYTAFTHQYYNGLDRVRIDFKAGPVNDTSTATANIYSSYGYLRMSDLRVVSGVPMGTVSMHTFTNFTGGTALGITNQHGQDATNLTRPMASAVAPSRIFTNVDLRDFLVTIFLFADTYDSVQYRSIRGNLWIRRPLDVPAPIVCP